MIQQDRDVMVPYSPYDVFQSRTLAKFFSGLDEKLWNMETTITELKDSNKELQDAASARLSADMRHQQMMIGETLKACLSTPSVSSLGTVGATVLMKIREMDSIEQVKEYIQQIADDNQEEIEKLQNK